LEVSLIIACTCYVIGVTIYRPFPSESDAKDLTNDVSNEDIYASLQDVSAQTAMYANVQDLYQESTEEDLFGYGDEKIYDSICYYQSPVTHTAHHVVAM
jgi:hypothetical protein